MFLEDDADTIYDILQGFYSENIPSEYACLDIENAFAIGAFGDIHYQLVADARERLHDRLHIDDDMDVETIIAEMEQIARYVGIRMFAYGMKWQQEKEDQK